MRRAVSTELPESVHVSSVPVPAQLLLSEYLQYDLYHSVGSYSVAKKRLAKLEARMKHVHEPEPDAASDQAALEQDTLRTIIRLSRRYNNKLMLERHFACRSSSGAGGSPEGHPIPEDFPLTLRRRFNLDDHDEGVEDARRNPWARPLAWGWVLNFYEAAIAAIDAVEEPAWLTALETEKPGLERRARTFADCVVWPRDRHPHKKPVADEREQKERRRRRLRRARFEARKHRALQQLPGVPRTEPHRSDDATEFLHRIATDNLSSGAGSVPLFVISALAEAHFSQHAVEAWQSMALGAHAEHAARHLKKADDPHEEGWLQKELNRCIVLCTFAYCASRCAPWMFAADDHECEVVFEDFGGAWENAVPTRCMWIAAQVGLLALHRRAYSHGLKGDRISAYNDYHKLQRQIRNTRRKVDRAPLHIAGAVEFLTCLEAQSNQNIGELYRAQHAQQPALKHFRTAHECLTTIRGMGEMEEVLTNSRWYVELQVSQGKASYELGHHKEALHWHLQGWRAFLGLLAAETQTESRTDDIDKAIEWLEEIKFEPDLRKGEAQRMLQPVIDQLDRIHVSERLGALASEILLRLGHVLLVLRLGLVDDPPSDRQPIERWKDEVDPRVKEMLTMKCLRKAAECNPRSTLVGSDLLKARLRIVEWLLNGEKRPLDKERLEVLASPAIAAIADQSPRGGDDFEQISRVTEYLILRSLDPDTASDPDRAPEREIEIREHEVELARGLLADFLMHTDSINVRKAQTHHYLMRRPNGSGPPRYIASAADEDAGRNIDEETAPGKDESPQHVHAEARDPREESRHPEVRPSGPAIEFVCMRRYSSAFPLLPRPSAFRAHGGGYFVRLHASDATEEQSTEGPTPRSTRGPLGVVVDPGPDFVENLYRTGFSLSDINVIVVTHDHVDHLNSLESLLSLLHYRDGLLPNRAQTESSENAAPGEQGTSTEPTLEQRAIPVYGNESIIKRYRRVLQLNPDEEEDGEPLPRVFKPLEDIAGEPILPEGFTIESMSSKRVDTVGHRDLSEKPSLGVCFAYEQGEQRLSLAISSDTPAPADPESDPEAHREWKEAWESALTADVLVSHISTVPLSELRQMARLDARLTLRVSDVRDLKERGMKIDEQIAACKWTLREGLSQISDTIAHIEGGEPQHAHPSQILEDARHERALLKKLRRRVRTVARRLAELETCLDTIEEMLLTLEAPTSDARGRDARETGEEHETTPRLAELMHALAETGGKLDAKVEGLREKLRLLSHQPVLWDELECLAAASEALARDAQHPLSDADEFERIRTRLQDADLSLRDRIDFAMWLGSRRPGPTADLVGRVPSSRDDLARRWRPPQDHPYLKGTLAWAHAYQQARGGLGSCGSTPGGLFVLGELSEELGTARSKIAKWVNETLFNEGTRTAGQRSSKASESERRFSALTSDVGLHLFVIPADSSKEPGSRKWGHARILCTTCDLDTDRVPEERYHAAEGITEVCVKGENEGIFYNCSHHDPGAQSEPLFLEQLERFDVFGR